MLGLRALARASRSVAGVLPRPAVSGGAGRALGAPWARLAASQLHSFTGGEAWGSLPSAPPMPWTPARAPGVPGSVSASGAGGVTGLGIWDAWEKSLERVPEVGERPGIAEEVGEAPAGGAGGEGGAGKEGIWAIKRTYQPSTLKRKRRHGFLYRVRKSNPNVLKRRRQKGRWRITMV